MKKMTLLLAMAMTVSLSVNAQKIKKQSGDLKPLKGSTMAVNFDYSDMTVGKNLTEEEYVDKKVSDYNKDEAGKGDKWKEGWENAREERYEPKFMELFTKYAGDNVKIAQMGGDAKYTLIVRTTYTEPGFNIGVMRQNAYINVEYIVVETANPDKTIASFVQAKVPGAQFGGYDFDAGSRIAESYAKAGKTFGGFFAKNTK